LSRYRKIDPRVWNDEKFRQLPDDAKLVFFMLLTHPHMTAIGAMRASLSGLAEELGWEAKAFREAFAKVCDKGMAEHDGKACLVALPNFLRYNSPESPNVIKAWVGSLDLLPECTLKSRVVARSKAFAEGLSKGFAEALPEAFAKGMPYQEQEQEQEPKQEQKQEPRAPRSAAPRASRFDDFWSAWPQSERKQDRKKCADRWITLGLDALADRIIADVESRKTGRKWSDRQYIEAPLVYLNGRRWEDGYRPDMPSASPGSTGAGGWIPPELRRQAEKPIQGEVIPS